MKPAAATMLVLLGTAAGCEDSPTDGEGGAGAGTSTAGGDAGGGPPTCSDCTPAGDTTYTPPSPSGATVWTTTTMDKVLREAAPPTEVGDAIVVSAVD